MENLSPKDLGDLLDYDRDSGVITWKARDIDLFADENHGKIWNSRFPGKIAGSVHYFGYRKIAIYGKPYFAHKLAWAIHYGEWPSRKIDHINGNRDDNRVTNLRLASSQQNNRNSTIKSNYKHSIYKGVGWHERDGRWRMRIRDGNNRITKYYKLEIDAAIAYDQEATRIFGEFAKTNKSMGLLSDPVSGYYQTLAEELRR